MEMVLLGHPSFLDRPKNAIEMGMCLLPYEFHRIANHLIWRAGRSGHDRWQLLKFEMPRYDNSKLTGEARL